MKRIIPSLVLDRDGALLDEVALSSLERAHDPAEVAWAYARAGADEILFVARDARLEALCRVAERAAPLLSIPLAFWTDLATVSDVGDLLAAGAARIAIQRAALRDPDLIASLAREFGSESIAAAITAGGAEDGWRVFDSPGGAPSEWDAVTWARVVETQHGGELIVESLSGGTLGGPFDLELLRAVTSGVARPVVAAGTAGQVEDLFDALMIGDANGVLVGTLLHSGQETVKSVRAFLDEHGLGMAGGR